MSRRFLTVFLCAFGIAALPFATLASAQSVPVPPPVPEKGPDASPPPPDFSSDPELEPQVTIIRRGTDTVEEVRVNGQLRYVKVTPRIGPPYYLVPNGNGQTFQRFDSLDSGLKTPMWLLFSW